MHLYARAVGLSEITSRSAMDTLLTEIIEKAIKNDNVCYYSESDDDDSFYEAQINYPMLKIQKLTGYEDIGGISIRGYYNPDTKVFKQTFFFPYIIGSYEHFTKEITVERQSDKEAYMVHCNEPGKEIVPIYFLSNIVEYLINENGKNTLNDKINYISALSISGKIILPIKQSKAQILREQLKTKKRNRLVDLAMKGNVDAIGDLTMGDYDIISDIFDRVRKEDLYSIINSSFIPIGLECDKYSIIGNITDLIKINNEITGEEVYYMIMECNDNIISLGINSKDLYGVPQVGMRFVGKVWLQGSIDFEIDDKSNS